jgi:hypothetical protein
VCFKQRYKSHFLGLKKKKHSNPYFQNIYNKNSSGWVFEAIQYIKPQEELLREAEQKYLDMYCGSRECINTNPIARRPPSKLGWKQKPETIAKRVASNKGRKATLEQKKVMSLQRKGRKWSPEIIQKRAEANKGRKNTIATKLLMKLSALAREAVKHGKACYIIR